MPENLMLSVFKWVLNSISYTNITSLLKRFLTSFSVREDLMEKTLVLALTTGNKRFSTSLHKLFDSYAEILASQGLVATAMKFLKFLESGDFSPEFSILWDRIALSAGPEVTNTYASENTQSEISLPYQKVLLESFPPAPISNAQQFRTTFVPLNPSPYFNSKMAQTVAPPMRPMTPIQQVAAEPASVAPPPTVQTILPMY